MQQTEIVFIQCYIRSVVVVQLHLFSTPGEPFLADVITAVQQIVADLNSPVVAYLPAAAEKRHFVRETKAAFRGLAEVRTIKLEIHSADQIRSGLDSASLVYLPGGNTYLAAHRLHHTGLMDDLRKRIQSGLPLVAFSAGTVLCGIDILTSNDRNDCGCTTYTGLGLLPLNFNVHYPSMEGPERQERDARLLTYSAKYQRAVLAMEEGAYILAREGRVQVIKGQVWKFDEEHRSSIDACFIPRTIA